MKRIIKKVHHFTKAELAAEEVIIILIICFLMAAAGFAATAILPIKAEVVQCGAREELPRACRRDHRCCALLDQLGEASRSLYSDDNYNYPSEQENSRSYPFDENTDVILQ